uniref:YLP motif-containing protein 1-like n=1 Tax=Pristiophorus japonicus TaxID=55135 RepID=UPI00398E37C5
QSSLSLAILSLTPSQSSLSPPNPLSPPQSSNTLLSPPILSLPPQSSLTPLPIL